jgi:hypothetical protein
VEHNLTAIERGVMTTVCNATKHDDHHSNEKQRNETRYRERVMINFVMFRYNARPKNNVTMVILMALLVVSLKHFSRNGIADPINLRDSRFSILNAL